MSPAFATARVSKCLLASATLLHLAAASAAPLPSDDLERRCWLDHTRVRTEARLTESTNVSFSNLRNGFAVASPFEVSFAVRGMGVAPAGKLLKGTGHHHILVDTPMPPSLTDKIPFNDKHRHFGKGQSSTLLDLPAGKHTLRLLFADDQHRPYFVFSREIEIEVKGRRSDVPRPKIDPGNFAQTCAAWYQDEVSRPRPPDEPLHFANLRAGEPVVSPFNVRLGVDGFGICARGASAEKTGHFMLEVLTAADRRTAQSFNLTNGSTQANVFVGVGSYVMRLRFVDPVNGIDLLPPHEMPVSVAQQERL